MKNIKFVLALCVFLVPAIAASQAQSQETDAAAEDPVIARINGYEILTSEVVLAADELLPQLGNIPAGARYPFVVQYLIERHLLAQAAVQANMVETEEFRRRLNYFRAKSLRDAYFFEVLQPTVTEEQAREVYDREAANLESAEQVHARHILVDDEATAQDLINQLNGGADFQELAIEHSNDPGAADGGDLGYFTREEMVSDFSDAAFSLQPGEYSGPVETQFGWHIILVEDRSTPVAQPFEELKDGLIRLLAQQAVQEAVQSLQEQSVIEILDEDLQGLVVTEDDEDESKTE